MGKKDKKAEPAAPAAPFNNPFAALAGKREELPSKPAPVAASAKVEERKGPARAVVRHGAQGPWRQGGDGGGAPGAAAKAEREVWLKALKGSLGCGGVVEEESLVLQGDHRERLPALLEARGVRRVVVS